MSCPNGLVKLIYASREWEKEAGGEIREAPAESAFSFFGREGGGHPMLALVGIKKT
jgi:hypothetical protein